MSECDVPVLGILHFSGGIGKIWFRKKVSEPVLEHLVPKKVSEPVLEKFGTGKKSRNRYRKNLVSELIFVAKIWEFQRFITGSGTI